MFCLHEIKGTKVFREASLLLRLLIPPFIKPFIKPFNPSFYTFNYSRA